MDNCLFCKIVNKQIPAKIEMETESLLAFADITPKAPCHVLFIPKKHIESLDKLTDEDSGLIGKIMLEISKFARKNGFHESGYRIVNNMGKDGGQTVFHIHFHLLAGRSFNWPPG